LTAIVFYHNLKKNAIVNFKKFLIWDLFRDFFAHSCLYIIDNHKEDKHKT